MHIAQRPVGLQAAPCIIAEMSGNHNRSLDRALGLSRSALYRRLQRYGL